MSTSYQYVKGALKVSEDGVYCELPHSCDEWNIGTVADAIELIEDLEEFVAGTYKNYVGKYEGSPENQCFKKQTI
jgi:hypothetical protein